MRYLKITFQKHFLAMYYTVCSTDLLVSTKKKQKTYSNLVTETVTLPVSL